MISTTLQQHGEPATRGRRGRAHPRRKVFQPASMTLADGEVRAHVLDISQGGARLHCPMSSAPNDAIVLRVCAVVARGHVVWRRGDRIGVCFDRLLCEDEIDRLTG